MINITLNHMPSVSSQSLNAVADQDTFYDVTDVLEEQGMEEVIKRHTDRKNGDLDLLEQFQIYEAVLRFEDGVSEDSEQPAFDSIRFVLHCSRDSQCMLTHYTYAGSAERLNATKARTNRARAGATRPNHSRAPSTAARS